MRYWPGVAVGALVIWLGMAALDRIENAYQRACCEGSPISDGTLAGDIHLLRFVVLICAVALPFALSFLPKNTRRP